MKRRNTFLLSFFALLLVSMIMGGCSAPFHLRKALQKDPSILDIEADTTIEVNVKYVDTTIVLKQSQPVKFVTDTVKGDTIVEVKEGKVNSDTTEVISKDSIAHAKAWIKDNRLFVEAWAVIDTTVNWKDTVKVKNKIIDSLKVIDKKNKATITEKESFISKIEKWAIVAGIFIFVLAVVVLIIKK